MFQKISSEKVIGFPNGTINVFDFQFQLYKYKNISLSSRMSKSLQIWLPYQLSCSHFPFINICHRNIASFYSSKRKTLVICDK